MKFLSTGKQKWLAVPAAALAVLAGLVLYWTAAIFTADCMVRVSFTGLENMFHVPYEYYAALPSRAVRVPGLLAKLVLGSEVAERDIYDDADTAYWFAELQYGKDELTADSKPYLETSFGPDYWLVYNSWTRNSPAPEEKDLALMLRAAENLHDGNLENWHWQGGGATGLTDFLVIRHGNTYLLEQESKYLLRPEPDGTFRQLMEVPKNGQFDYYAFKTKGGTGH